MQNGVHLSAFFGVAAISGIRLAKKPISTALGGLNINAALAGHRRLCRENAACVLFLKLWWRDALSDISWRAAI